MLHNLHADVRRCETKIMTSTFHDGPKRAGSVRPIAANCIARFEFREPIGIVSIARFELPFKSRFEVETGSLLVSILDSDWRLKREKVKRAVNEQ